MNYDEFLIFLDKYEEQSSFAKKIQFANAYLGKQIGSGSGRIVYNIDGVKVFKIVKNTKGLAQNEAEIDASSRSYNQSIITKVFDHSKDDLWIVAELGRKVSEKRIKEITGIPSLFILGIYLHNWNDRNNGRREVYRIDDNIEEEMENNEWVNSLTDFIDSNNHSTGDMNRPSTYGEVIRNGQPEIVLTDYGLSNDVYSSHYDRNRKINNLRELYNFGDGNDDILSDIGDTNSEVRSMWALMPYSVSDGDDVVNLEESKIEFIENNSKYPNKPIKNIGYLTDLFHEAYNSIYETMKIVSDKKKYYNNLLKLQEYLINVGAYNRDRLPELIDETQRVGDYTVKKMIRRLDYITNLLFKMDFIGVINYYINDKDFYDKTIKNKFDSYLEKNPEDKKFYLEFLNHINLNESDSTLFSTDGDVSSTGFPTYDQGYYGCDTDYEDIDKHYVNERQLHWIPGSQAVTVKKKCRLGGNGSTSTACNTGDVNNLKFSKLKENDIAENYLIETIKASEAYRDEDSLQTILDGKRNVGLYLTYNYPRLIHKLKISGLNVQPVKQRGSYTMGLNLIYTDAGKQDAKKLYDYMIARDGYVSDRTPEEARYIGHLLGYDDESIEEYVNRVYVEKKDANGHPLPSSRYETKPEAVLAENVFHEISLNELKSIATKSHIGWLLPDNTFIYVRNHVTYLRERYKDIIDKSDENPNNDEYPDVDLYRMAYDEGLVRIWMEIYDGGPELGIRGNNKERIRDIVKNVYYEFFANKQSRVYIDVFGGVRDSYKFYLPQDKEEFANFIFGSGSNNNGVITEDYENLQNLQRYRYYLGWLLPDDTFVPVEKHQDYLEKIFPYEGDANKDNWYEYQEYVKSLYKKGFDQGLIRIDVRTTNGLPHLAIQGVDQNRIKSILQDVYYGYYSKIESYVYVDISDGNPNYTTGHKYYKFNLPQDKEEFANFVFGSGSNNNGVINEKNVVVKENSNTFANSNESSNQLNESNNMDAFVSANIIEAKNLMLL